MKLSIIPVDGTVCENGLCYTDLIWSDTPSNIHALQWQDNSGWLEFNNEQPNEIISLLPAWANNAMEAWAIANTPAPPSPPTAENNKQTATYKLQQTDWTELPSVINPAQSNPYLSNQEEFISYRNSVRKYAINPIAGDIDWPATPEEVWIEV